MTQFMENSTHQVSYAGNNLIVADQKITVINNYKKISTLGVIFQ